MDVHDATTELPDSVNIRSNTTDLNKTHVNVTLARPALINSSAIHNIRGPPFPLKINDDCLPWLLSPSFFYGNTLSSKKKAIMKYCESGTF